MRSPVGQCHLTSNGIERLKSRSPRFRILVSRKVSQLSHMLLLNINRKIYIWGMQWQCDLELP